MKISHCNPTYKQNERKKLTWASHWFAEKAFDKIQHPFIIKVWWEIRYTKNILKHKKGIIQQTNSQHQIKWRRTQSNSFEIRNKTKLSTLSICIQYSTWISSLSNKTTKENQKSTNQKRRSQIFAICRWYDSIHKSPQKFYLRTPKADKYFLKCG